VLVALEFHYRSVRFNPHRIALFPGAFNPPTVAHVAIALAAHTWASEVVWTLPRAFPHKGYEGADLHARLEMLRRLAAEQSGFSVAVASGGLYVEIADEARQSLGAGVEIGLVCGRDAAERIAAWDYGRPGVFESLIERYPLLVAGRAGEYLPAPHHVERIIPLAMDPAFNEVSSTEVRRRIATGEPWRQLVPAAIADLVASAYNMRLHEEHRHAPD
jgi:nicotinate-nucleotide adenylyltransferase